MSKNIWMISDAGLYRRFESLKAEPAVLLWIFASLVSIGFILIFTMVVGLRLFYPYELEWIEGGMVDQIRWILSGRPLYGPPNIHFIPYAYTPIFFFISASLMKFIGVGYLAPRSISILASFGCFLLIYLIGRRTTRDPIPGLLAAGIYAACYQFTGVWMDLTKVDSLFMFFTLAAILASLDNPSKAQMLLSGLLLALAYFTKQLALPLVLVWAPLSLLHSRGRTWPIWLTAITLGGLVFWGFDALSQGWFSFYTFKTLSVHPRVSDWWIFWRLILGKMWPAFLLLLAVLPLQMKGLPIKLRPAEHSWETLAFTAGLLATSWAIYLKIWTYTNDLMPACAAMAIGSGLGVHALRNYPREPVQNRCKAIPKAELIAFLLILSQFALLLYNPLELVPSEKLYRKAQKMVQKVHDLPGEVLSFNRGFINEQAGKTTYLHSAAYADVITGSFDPTSDSFRRQQSALDLFRHALASQKFDWIATDISESFWLPYYVRVGDFIQDKDLEYPGRDSRLAPSSLFAPNPLFREGELPLRDLVYNGLFIKGWDKPNESGRRMNAGRAEVMIALEKSSSYLLTLQLQPDCFERQPRYNAVRIYWNSEALGEILFRSCAPHTAEFRIFQVQIRDQELNRLALQIQPATDSLSDATMNALPPYGAQVIALRFARK